MGRKTNLFCQDISTRQNKTISRYFFKTFPFWTSPGCIISDHFVTHQFGLSWTKVKLVGTLRKYVHHLRRVIWLTSESIWKDHFSEKWAFTQPRFKFRECRPSASKFFKFRSANKKRAAARFLFAYWNRQMTQNERSGILSAVLFKTFQFHKNMAFGSKRYAAMFF